MQLTLVATRPVTYTSDSTSVIIESDISGQSLGSRTTTVWLQYIDEAKLNSQQFLFPSRICYGGHITTRQYSRRLRNWIKDIGLNPLDYGTHSLRRTKATLIYRRTKNLRAVQLLLGHSKLESTVRYLGIEVEDAFEMAERTDV